MKAMILAAGRGQRMGSLTNDLPKPLLPVAGKPLIEYHLVALASLGITEVVINVSYLGHLIEAQLGDGRRFGVTIRYSHEQQALETAGGIKRALPWLGDEPFLVVNGDVFLPQGLPPLISFSANDLAHLWLTDNPDHNPGGDFALEHGRLTLSSPKLTYTGISVLHPDLFQHLDHGAQPLAPLLRQAIAESKVSGEYWPNAWLDVGTPERLQQAGRMTS